MGGGRVLVAEPESNDGDVDSRLEQMQRQGQDLVIDVGTVLVPAQQPSCDEGVAIIPISE